MKKIKKLLRKNWLTSTLVSITIFISIGAFVFWMEDKTLAPLVIWHKISHPHEIDFVDDIASHWWEFVIIISITLNIGFFYSIFWFYAGLNKGMLRWGGKSGND